eukprot:CAMPEP_0202446172 /NCGR_PEP_ID=MMETSP1360-20130828/4767_1 /ASSEMBLY_ACC=CAM_ASM_000848 /TAXON_ID=515479 /ORGANISM="Licmophora paradoxa, Strain CCMP2313" /LENGTH=74 /DNA_ID=CAMNT_0049062613 /DNA_START=127 /DNA_END=351 /DNA_ORIENTATION=+
MKSIVAVLLLAFIGVAAAFFRPAVPFQVVDEIGLDIRGGGAPVAADLADPGLDNLDIVEDSNIHPARKCGFCMG